MSDATYRNHHSRMLRPCAYVIHSKDASAFMEASAQGTGLQVNDTSTHTTPTVVTARSPAASPVPYASAVYWRLCLGYVFDIRNSSWVQSPSSAAPVVGSR